MISQIVKGLALSTLLAFVAFLLSYPEVHAPRESLVASLNQGSVDTSVQGYDGDRDIGIVGREAETINSDLRDVRDGYRSGAISQEEALGQIGALGGRIDAISTAVERAMHAPGYPTSAINAMTDYLSAITDMYVGTSRAVRSTQPPAVDFDYPTVTDETFPEDEENDEPTEEENVSYDRGFRGGVAAISGFSTEDVDQFGNYVGSIPQPGDLPDSFTPSRDAMFIGVGGWNAFGEPNPSGSDVSAESGVSGAGEPGGPSTGGYGGATDPASGNNSGSPSTGGNY